MENPVYKRLGRLLWVAIVLLVVLLAVYVSGGRFLAANLSNYQALLLRELNERMPFTVDAQQVRGEWRAFTPVIVMTQLRLGLPDSSSPPLELSEGRLGVDVLNSLRTRSLQMRRLALDGLTLRGEFSAAGELRLAGFGEGASESAAALREFLLNIESMELRNNRLLLTMPNGDVRNLQLDLQLSREGSERRVRATLTSTAGARIAVRAQGLGDPFRPEQFSGQAYLDIQSTNLGAVRDLLAASAPPAWANGAADMQLWLAWDRGTPTVQARLEARDLRIAAPDASWQLPLQRVALQAQLLRRPDHWSLFVSDVQVEQGGVVAALPRLQMEKWDSALRLRAENVPLEPIGAILAGQPDLPAGLRDAAAALRPRGRLPNLQATISDVGQPSQTWEALANFADIAVESWHGAPGAVAATGFARIEPGGASVILDSQSMSLDFPAIYRAPLNFHELYGTLLIAWDANAVRLDSGLLTARGEEGTTKVLFGLDIPLQDSATGIEMDLLVGLQDSHSRHRAKYIPYVLDPALLSWLEDSIGDGRIEQGAFLWRGSLRSGATPLRTVQLAFNVADTPMTYHPKWPPVLVEEGVVLINDSAVSVWAPRARLFDSQVEHLSVETRVSARNHITLDVRGAVHGPAADGFKVLNESALADILGQTFAEWRATGELDTDLQIHMDLSDASVRPRVDVATRWRDVDLLVSPGNLPVQSVNGEFDYSTTTGFSTRGLTGTLWGETVAAEVKQQHAAGSDRYDPAGTVVDVALAAELDMANVRQWLQLDLLAFARGQAGADARIRLAPGASPVLTVDSELSGISLDLPQPWNKTAKELRPLHLEMPLARGTMPLSLALAQQLQLQLELVDGHVRGGAVGLGESPGPVQEGALRVTGHAPLVRVDEWLDFVTRYAGANALQALSPAAAPAVERGSAESPTESAGTSLQVDFDDVRIDSLVVLEQELNDVVFSLALQPERWNAALETDWLHATLSLQRQGGASRLEIEHFNLDRLPDFMTRGDRGDSDWDLPPVEVQIANLFRSGKRLGHLAFELQGQGGEFTASNVTGELAHLRLPVENPARLVWHRGQAPYTELQAGLQFGDLGQTLEYFDYQRIVETVRGNIDIDLRWPGAPQDFSLADGEGAMHVQIGQGNFLEATAGATGALRVVSILNLADIVQRLSLSNMFESGIPFDSVDGDIDLRSGRLRVAHLDVKGGSSFQFSGSSDVQTKKIDGELVATLPVARNLPWIAALAASLPVAAGVYVVSQVFDQQMNRLSSAVYTIRGTWNDPEVNFDRIFDNTAQPTGDSPPLDQSPP